MIEAKIKAVALDVDGVLTDGTFWWDTSGAELKRFSFRDVMGITRAAREGIVFALISGEQNDIVDRYASKLGITSVWQGCKDKASALREFAAARSLDLDEVCFMGDDINDLEALKIAGICAAPADAHESVLRVADFIATKPGGMGAVRELVDHLQSM